jgi:glycolate oxidase FAD binding subunit
VEVTTCYELTQRASISRINKLCAQSLPISASCFDGKLLTIRLSGTECGVNAALNSLGGDQLNDADAFWNSIKEQTHPFFNSKKRIWRISLTPSAPPLKLLGEQLLEWRGAQRWLCSEQAPEIIREQVNNYGGHATIFRNAQPGDKVFHPISGKLHELHMNVKLAMDPHCLFNPNRMHDGF